MTISDAQMNQLSTLYGEGDIRAVLRPALLAELPAESPEWRAERRAAARDWRWKYWMRRLGLAGSEKAETHVKQSYELNWTVTALPSTDAGGRIPCSWNASGFYLTPYAEKRVHAFILHRIIQILQPQKVLEVGSGNGVMSLLTAGGYPATQVTGFELTDAGIRAGRAAAASTEALQKLAAFAPFPFDHAAARKVEFVQGSAVALPFGDAGFDLVYTSLALEQMSGVMEKAVAEIHRVTAGHVVMIEPFRDANVTPERRYFTVARDYFRFAVDELRARGFEPVKTFMDFPAKLTRGVAVVIARPIR